MAHREQSSATKVHGNRVEVKNLLSEELKNAFVVADTSALLIRGTDLLKSLPECTLVVPVIVIKELENKRSSPTVGFLARDWLRLIEKLRVEHGEELSSGVTIRNEDQPGKLIKLIIEPNHTTQNSLPAQLQDGSNDSTILAVARNFSLDPKVVQKVALISNDVPMRIHSTLELKIPAYEVSSATMESIKPFSGRISVHVSDEQVDSLFRGTEDGALDELDRFTLEELIREQIGTTTSNSMVDVFHDGKQIQQLLYSRKKSISKISKIRAKGVTPKTVEQSVAMDYLMRSVSELPIVSVSGKAGTGKTLVTLAAGLEGVRLGKYQKVIVFRSLHEMGIGQEMGFLPGGVDEKIAPWSGAVMDALEVIAKSNKKSGEKPTKLEIDTLKVNVEVSPISYLRGRSITDTFMVLDEAQNFSRNELLNIMSRAGDGTKVVLLFDSDQIDNKFLQAGPRAEVWSAVDLLKSSDLFAHVSLLKSERSAVAELASDLLSM